MNIREYSGISIDSDLVTISVSGEDSSKFLQGQLSNDINDLDKERYQYSSFSTNQGKVIGTMRIFKRNEQYILLINRDVANFVTEGLRKYVLMSKVDIKPLQSQCYGVLGNNLINNEKLKLKKNGKFQNFVVDGTGYEVPLFVFDKLGDVSDTDIKKGLAFTRKLIMNKFFLINNIQFPKSRITLENYF